MHIINDIEVCHDKNVTRFRRDGKDYYVCNICGRVTRHKCQSDKKFWCQKHYNQLRKHGHVKDANPRTQQDRNRIIVKGDIAEMELYDKESNVIAITKFDADDIQKVRYTKWKLSASGYVMNTPKFKGATTHLSRVILDTDTFVDHINHDPLDNRRNNLRPVTKSQNQMNANYKGVTTRKDGRFHAHIKLNGKLLNLGVYMHENEAMYARWYAETLLFGQYRYPKTEPELPEQRKAGIRKYVERKVQRL